MPTQWKLGEAGRSELGSTTFLGNDQALMPAVYVDPDSFPSPRVYEFELLPTKFTNSNSFGTPTVTLDNSLRATEVLGMVEIAIADAPLRATEVLGMVEIAIADAPLRFTEIAGMAEVYMPADLRFTEVAGMAEVSTPADIRFTEIAGMAELDVPGYWEAVEGVFVWMM